MIGPSTVSYTLTKSGYEYLMRMLNLGLVEGPIGDMKTPPEIVELVHAIHHVLAGGKAEVKITLKGNPDIVNELNAKLDNSAADSNAINKAAGYYVTLVP